VIGAKRLAASIAVKLIAAGAKHLPAGGIGAWPNFEDGDAAVFVILHGKVLEQRVAIGAGGGSEFRSHVFTLCLSLRFVKHEIRHELNLSGVMLGFFA
jgi:hypothetical protein